MGEIFQRADYWSLSADSKECQMNSQYRWTSKTWFKKKKSNITIQDKTPWPIYSPYSTKGPYNISAFIFIAKIGNGPLLFRGTKLQMLLYSQPNALSYWCGTINHIKYEFYSLGKLAPPKFIHLTALPNTKASHEQASCESNTWNITTP